MSRCGKTNSERFPGGKSENGLWICRVCRKEIPKDSRRSSFCSHRCLRDFFMLTDWQRVRRVIYERDGGVCMKCGKPVSRDDYHVDHIFPISRGGAEWDLVNLELSCPRCNLSKGAKIDSTDNKGEANQ